MTRNDIPDVPQTITWEAFKDWVAVLGLKPEDIPNGSTVTLRRGCISVEVFALDENGSRYVAGDEVATHTLAVRITGGPWGS